MNDAIFANLLLSLVCVCALVGALADTVASHQIAMTRYRWVPTVSLLRKARVPAALGAVTLTAFALYHAPLFSLLGVLVALLTAVTYHAAMYGGSNSLSSVWQVGLRCFFPTLLFLEVVLNSSLFLHLPVPLTSDLFQEGALAELVLTMAAFWFIGYQRLNQDLLYLRD